MHLPSHVYSRIPRIHQAGLLVVLPFFLPGLGISPPNILANPAGGVVVHGTVEINDQNPGHLTIQQGTNKAIINWQDFSISPGELTEFIQPGTDAMALNRVISGNPSTLLGTLRANGGILLVNPNGILVGGGGVVDIGGLAVLSTLDIDDQDFLDGGDMRFHGGTAAGVTNLGTITSRGGDVVLMGNMILNEGTVGAPDGTVAFGAGGEFIVDTVGDSRLSVVAAGQGGGTGIRNTGTVSASAVEFKTHGNVYALAIQNSGIVRANGIRREGGRIILSAAGSGGSSGTIENTGTLQARNADGSGGEILIDAGQAGMVNLLGGRVDADGVGNQNGGSVTILGSGVRIDGDAAVSADGADGGYVQIGSSEFTQQVTVGSDASVSANGKAGNGGAVHLLGTGESQIDITGRVTVAGTATGGIVRLSGGDISGHPDSLISADGGEAGGDIQMIGNGVNLGGTISTAGQTGSGGELLVQASHTLIATPIADMRVDGATAGGRLALDSEETIQLAGQVSATSDYGIGGRVQITGDRVLIGAPAMIDASGNLGGGTVQVGGSFQGADTSIRQSRQTVIEEGARIAVDAIGEGDGGRTVVWSDGSTFYRGDISARALGSVGNGGFIEVSGKESLSVGGSVSTLSAHGQNGTFLIDPVDVSIGPGSGTISDAALVAFVQSNHVIIHTSGDGIGTGDIRIEPGASIIYDSPNSLTFLAHNHIFVNGDVKNHGKTDAANTGHITLVAGWEGILPDLPNDPGHPQTLSGEVTAFDFVNPDGTPLDLPGPFGSWGVSGGSIHLNDAGLEPVEVGSARGQTNLFGDVVQLQTGRGDGRFTQVGYRRVADSRDTTGGYEADPSQQIVDGDIHVSGLTAVILRNSDDFSITDGNKVRNFVYNRIGHGGQRNNNNNIDARSGTEYGHDSGVVGVADGDNSGNITVYAGIALAMEAGRVDAPSHIGHGGLGNAAFDSGNTPFTSANIVGDMSGDITITAGILNMEAGLYDDAFAMIGHGGRNVRGEHSGDINITTTSGGVRASAAPTLDHTSSDNNRDRSFVQIGHGGHNSDHLSALPARTITIAAATPGAPWSGTGNNTSLPGDGISINPDTGLPYGHSGEVTISSAGGVHFTATGNDAFAQVGHGGLATSGDHRGDISVVAANGDIIFDRIALQLDVAGADRRNRGTRAHVKIGHGGGRSNGGHTGDIEVQASGDIAFYGGRSESFAQIGHGGRAAADTQTIGGVGSQRQTESANGTHSGDITATAGGDIIFRSGFGSGSTAFSQIGHGGYRNLADIYDDPANSRTNPDGTIGVHGGGASAPDQQGHNGEIVVTAEGDISFAAGQVEGEILPGQEPFGIESNRTLNYTMIGHGGDEAFGDHWGGVTISAGGDLEMEARGGWDAVTIEGTNAGPAGDPASVSAASRGTPRLGSTEDNGGTGTRNFAMIGHGGFNASHRTHSTQTNNSSGKVGEGIGTFGPSDISIVTGGDVRLQAARTELIGPKLPTPAIRQPLAGGVFTYLDESGNPVALSAEVSQHSARLSEVHRANGEIWLMPEPVYAAQDSFVQVGHGGRSTNYQGGLLIGGSADGIGHQGNITIDAGGGVIHDAGNFKTSVSLAQVVEIQATRPLLDGAGNPVIDPVTGLPALEAFTIQVGPGAPDADMIGTVGGTSGTDVRGQRNRSIHARNYAQIGNGGWNARGDHSGDITIRAGQTADGVGLRVQGGNGREDYAQVGNGGFDSDGYDPLGGLNSDNNRLGDTGSRGNISIDVAGDVTLQGGGTDLDATGAAGTTTNASALAAHDDDRYSYAQIGHGGAATGGSNAGDISVVSREGSLDVLAGNNSRYGYVMMGHGGLGARSESRIGDILAVAAGDVWVKGGVPFFDSIDAFGAPANTGQIGSTHIGYAQIGHGGWDSDPQGGNLNLTAGVGGNIGSIEVVSVDGSVIIQGGGDPGLTRNDDSFFRGLSAQIGHGGNFTDGDQRGDIRVAAGENVAVYGGAGGRDSYTMIGHGGLQMDGNLEGTIEVIAGADVIVNRGANTDTSTFDRAGQEIFNNSAQIGHGDHRYRQRSAGIGSRDGDIFISAGRNLIIADPAHRPFEDAAYARAKPDLVLIGHIDPINGSTSAFRTTIGHTYLGASRTDPHGGGGSARIHPDAVITSAGSGFFGELRLYLPSPAQNQIFEDATFNNSSYTRIPTPDGTRADELVGTDHTQGVGLFGEPDGTFLPEGPFSPSGFGLYNIYYAGDAPVDPPAPTPEPIAVLPSTEPVEIPAVETEIVINPFPDLLFQFLFIDKYDSFDRDQQQIWSPLAGGLLTSLGQFADTVRGWQADSSDIRVEGDEILEESPGLLGLGPAQSDEEKRKLEENAAQYRDLSQAHYQRFWTYNVSSQGYSSYTVFGVPYSQIAP